ncbi:unnamed protein product [Debaryomyces tyrocola]|nr:unnamed protein product [Debaryomyces tyrocola]
MSFVGVIDSEKNKVIWSKAILSLAAISDHIKFIICPDSLSISAVNNAKTSHAEIVFKKTFFYDYSVDFSNILPEGFDNDLGEDIDAEINGSKLSYSFVVNSKHLSILFKNLDAVDIDYICFKIHWSREAQANMKYKLLIEIKTKKLIIKKYQTSYQPVLKNQLTVSSVYKRELYSQQHKEGSGEIDERNRVNYIMIEQIIPKQFLDMIPASTEDFKIEIKNEKILLSGYTKQIQKDREYLKQQMSVTIALTLEELLNTNLTAEANIDQARKCINFRLRDFRNFMNLITSINIPTNAESNPDEYLNLNNMISMSNEDYFEIFFKNPGDPILFELQNNPHILIQYVQITNDDEYDLPENSKINVNGIKNIPSKLVLHPHVIHKVSSHADEENIPINVKFSDSSKIPKTKLSIPQQLRKLQPNTDNSIHTNELFVPEMESQTAAFDYSSNYENEDMITYGKRMSQTEKETYKKQKIEEGNGIGIVNIDMDRLNNMIDNKEKAKPDKRIIINEDTDYESDENEALNLGPTQGADRPKSIFD